MNSVARKSGNEFGWSLVLLGLAICFTWLLLGTMGIGGMFRQVGFLLLLTSLLLKQRWVIYLVSVGVVFAFSQRWYVGFKIDEVSVWRVLIFMGYLVFSLRFTDCALRLRLNAGVKRIFAIDTSRQQQVMREIRPVTAGLLWIPAAMLAACCLLWCVPLDFTTDDRLGIQPKGFRAITVLWLLSVGWFIGAGLFGWMGDRENDPVRARVYLRSVFGRQAYAELNPIEKNLVKKRSQQSD